MRDAPSSATPADEVAGRRIDVAGNQPPVRPVDQVAQPLGRPAHFAELRRRSRALLQIGVDLVEHTHFAPERQVRCHAAGGASARLRPVCRDRAPRSTVSVSAPSMKRVSIRPVAGSAIDDLRRQPRLRRQGRIMGLGFAVDVFLRARARQAEHVAFSARRDLVVAIGQSRQWLDRQFAQAALVPARGMRAMAATRSGESSWT